MRRFTFATLLVLLLPAFALAAPPSLYAIGTRFTDQHGRVETLAQLGDGHPVLISMFYGTCPMACPLLISRIQRIESALPPAQRAQLRVVMVTFDPKRDSVAVLSQLARAHRVDEARWFFLRTDDAGAVRELAAALGIKYRFLAGGAISHTSVITLLGPHGELEARLDGLDQPDAPLLQQLSQVSRPAGARQGEGT